MIPNVPKTRNFPVRFKVCPLCGNIFGVCRTDHLAKPSVWVVNDCWFKECLTCVVKQLHGVSQASEEIQRLHEHRARMHGLAVWNSAAAG